MNETNEYSTRNPKFTDECFSPRLVLLINRVLNSRELNAIEMWLKISELIHRIYDRSEEPFEGTPVQTSLETVVRENLLILICERKIKGYQQLAASFGFDPEYKPTYK